MRKGKVIYGYILRNLGKGYFELCDDFISDLLYGKCDSKDL